MHAASDLRDAYSKLLRSQHGGAVAPSPALRRTRRSAPHLLPRGAGPALGLGRSHSELSLVRGGGGSLPALRPYVAPGAEAAAAAGVEQLIATLDENRVSVIDLFRSWDTDASGSVTKKEFRKGIASALKVEPTLEELAALFSFLDPDGSGSIDYRELDAKLHRRNVRHAP